MSGLVWRGRLACVRKRHCWQRSWRRRLEAAVTLNDLAALPGNRLEALKGERKAQYSIRVNDQWRICFEWPEGAPGPSNPGIVDYH